MDFSPTPPSGKAPPSSTSISVKLSGSAAQWRLPIRWQSVDPHQRLRFITLKYSIHHWIQLRVRSFPSKRGSNVTSKMGLQRYAAQTQQGVQVNKLLLASTARVALGLGTPAALAAEMALPAPAPVAAPVYTNWSGCHAGAVAGTTWGSSNRTAVVTERPQDEGLPITGNFSLAGFTGGFDLGCDWQAGVWVFGVEGDWSADNKSGQAFALAPFNPL